MMYSDAELVEASKHGNTPLIIATLHCDVPSIKLLIDAGADINKANNDGETPLYISALYGDVVFVNLLLDAIYKDIADKVLLAVSQQDIIFDTAFVIFKKTVEVYIPVTQRMLISLKILNEPKNHNKLYDIFQEKFSNKNNH